MAVDSYSNLKTELTSQVKRGTSLDSSRDNWIDSAEAYFNRSLRTHQMMETSTLTTDSNGEASLPADFLAAYSARYTGSPNFELMPISQGGENRLSPYDTAGIPRWYSIRTEGGTQKIRVTPIASSASIVLGYYEKIPALSDSTTSNWLLALASDAYLYRCLYHAFLEMRNVEQAAIYRATAKEICDDLGALSEQARYHNAEMSLDGVTVA